MKHILISSASLLVVAIAAFAVARPVSQEPQAPEVTAHHRMLLECVGEWEGTFTLHIPGMDPMVVPAQETITAVGAYWTSSVFTCDLMGMPYKGTGVFGYDGTKKKFIGTWADSMSTYLSVMSGTYDADARKLTMAWEAPDMTGSVAAYRSETVHRSDAYVSTFFVGEGAGTKTMEIKMKRKTPSGGDAK